MEKGCCSSCIAWSLVNPYGRSYASLSSTHVGFLSYTSLVPEAPCACLAVLKIFRGFEFESWRDVVRLLRFAME